MLKVYMMKGLPGSGKTTRAMEMLAENPNGIKRVSKDDLRAMLDNGRWSGDAEKQRAWEIELKGAELEQLKMAHK